MQTPTITAAGTADGLFLVTDNKGLVHRIPKHNVASVLNSSNENVFRLDISHASGEINLQFVDAAEVAAMLAIIDGAY